MKHNLVQLSTNSCVLEMHPKSMLAFKWWRGFQHQTPFYNFDASFLSNELSKIIFGVTRPEDSAAGTNRYYVINNFGAFQIFTYLELNKALPSKITIRPEVLNNNQIERLAEKEIAGLFMNAVTRANAYQAYKIFQSLHADIQADILKPMCLPKNRVTLLSVFTKRFNVSRRDLVRTKRLSDPTDSDVLKRLNE